MTRKDFKLIASVIDKLNFTREHKLFIAQSFADRLTDTNPNFNRAKFVAACFEQDSKRD